MNNDQVITVGGALTNATPIGVTMQTPGVFTSSTGDVKAKDYAANFTSDNDSYIVAADGNELKAAHTHDFTYAADGATITATCGNTGCTLPPSSEGGTDHVATLTIAAPEHATYGDGKSADATITDENSIQGEAKVLYQKKTDGSYGTATETAPTDAGDYKASITVGGATASVEYTIAQAATSITENPTAGEITYGQTLADSTLTGGEASVAGGFAWKDSALAPAVSDSQETEYDVVFTPTDGNYAAAECKAKLTVNKADSKVAKAPEPTNPTYSGKNQALVTPGRADGGEMYYSTDGSNFSTDVPNGTEVGDNTPSGTWSTATRTTQTPSRRR